MPEINAFTPTHLTQLRLYWTKDRLHSKALGYDAYSYDWSQTSLYLNPLFEFHRKVVP